MHKRINIFRIGKKKTGKRERERDIGMNLFLKSQFYFNFKNKI